MKLVVKRVYEAVSPDDGYRVLVDRLWPRGVSKLAAHLDDWAKDLTPSTALRSWFHDDPVSRFSQFSKKYAAELNGAPAVAAFKKAVKTKKRITLVTAVKDVPHSHIPTLLKALQ